MKGSAKTADQTGIPPSPATLDRAAAPPLVPVEPAIDLAHLGRMTLGDAALERDVLALFCQQAAMLLDRMRGETPKTTAAFAHTLSGSARGIGAWRVAEAAEALEGSARRQSDPKAICDLGRLSAAVIEAQAAIAEMLARR